MDKLILVPLKASDRVEQILPYIEHVAQPGMKVVFLVPYTSPGFGPLLDKVLVIQTGIDPDSLPGRSKPEDLLEERKQLAVAALLPACATLRARKIHIGIEVYFGRLRKVVRHHMEQGNVHLVMMRVGSNTLLTSFLHKISSFARFLNARTFPPVLLLQSKPQN